MTDQDISLNEGPGQRRRVVRHKMFGPVALLFRGQTVRAHFLDLSCAGALAHSEMPPGVGTFLRIEAADLLASGRVIWTMGKRFGIQFSEPLAESTMQALIEGS